MHFRAALLLFRNNPNEKSGHEPIIKISDVGEKLPDEIVNQKY